MSEILIAQTEK